MFEPRQSLTAFLYLQRTFLTNNNYKLKARFHYKRGKEHSLFLLLIFLRLKLKQALSKAKKSIKQTKNNILTCKN